MYSLQLFGCVAVLWLCIAPAYGFEAERVEKRSLPTNARRARGSHSAFADIESFARHPIATPTVSPMPMQTPLPNQPMSSFTINKVRQAEQKVLAVDESHPQAISLLDSLQQDEIGHSSLVKAIHELSSAAKKQAETLSFLSYEIDDMGADEPTWILSSIEKSSPQLIEAIQRILDEFSATSDRSELLRSFDDALLTEPTIMTDLTIVDSEVHSNLSQIIAALQEDDSIYSSIVSEIRSLIIAEESDVQLQSAISSVDRHEDTEATLVSEFFNIQESPTIALEAGRGEIYGHTSTYQAVGRVASMKSSKPNLLTDLSSIESFEQSHSSIQRDVQSMMSAEGSSVLTSIENVVNQNEFETCTCAMSIESQLASFVELEIAYPYLAQDIVLIHKAKQAHSRLSAALEYISNFGNRHASLISQIYFDHDHPSVTSGQAQLASLESAYEKLFSAFEYVMKVAQSNSHLETALSIVSMVRLADPTVVTVIEYIVHEQSSEMSAAKYIGSLISTHPLILQDVDVIASYEDRYPHLASFEEQISTSYATEPTDVDELESAISSPSSLSSRNSLVSIEKTESSLWKAIQYVENITMVHSALAKAAKSVETLTEEHPSAVEQVIFEKEMDPSLVQAEQSVASAKMRHPLIPHDVDYVNDLEVLNPGLKTALSRFVEAQSTSPTVLNLMVQDLSHPSQVHSSNLLQKTEQQHESLFHDLEILTDVSKQHPSLITAFSSIVAVQASDPLFNKEFQSAESLTDSTAMSNLASIEVVRSSHPSFIADAEYLLHVAAGHQNLMSDFNTIETAQVSSPSTVYYFFKAAHNMTQTPSSYLEDLVDSYSTLWTAVDYANQLGKDLPQFAHDLDEVLSIVKSHPHIIADLLSVEGGTNPSVTAAEKLGVEEEQSLCQTSAVPHVQEVEEEVLEPAPKFASSPDTKDT